MLIWLLINCLKYRVINIEVCFSKTNTNKFIQISVYSSFKMDHWSGEQIQNKLKYYIKDYYKQ